jgi:hypothetical protein
MTFQSPTRASSLEGEQDQQSASRRASDFPTMRDMYDWLDTDAAEAEHPVGFSTEHRQEQDLSGLTVQASTTNVLESKLDNSKEFIEAIPEEQIRVCPVHGALFGGLYGPTVRPNPSQRTSHMPLERYVAEGLAERYALLSLNQMETGGEWARYSACLCGRK